MSISLDVVRRGSEAKETTEARAALTDMRIKSEGRCDWNVSLGMGCTGRGMCCPHARSHTPMCGGIGTLHSIQSSRTVDQTFPE
jgi:hypothetical protein